MWRKSWGLMTGNSGVCAWPVSSISCSALRHHGSPDGLHSRVEHRPQLTDFQEAADADGNTSSGLGTLADLGLQQRHQGRTGTARASWFVPPSTRPLPVTNVTERCTRMRRAVRLTSPIRSAVASPNLSPQ